MFHDGADTIWFAGQACMGAFVVYVLTLVGDAEHSLLLTLFRRCLMVCCIFVLTAITAVDNTMHLIDTEVASNSGDRVRRLGFAR